MPHIPLPDLPGITALFAGFPETAAPLRALAQTLLRGPSNLTPGERELIAAYVSRLNACPFCMQSHASASRHLLDEQAPLVDAVIEDLDSAPVDDRLRALLMIAGKVQKSGREVTPDDIERARRAGAQDRDIHDTVLIAAAFCMFNRYVDGLGTWAPEDPAAYTEMGERMAAQGYGRGSGGA